MWHRADGGLYLTVDEPTQRVDDQDWSRLTLHGFPAIGAAMSTSRTIYERGTAARTHIRMSSATGGLVRFEISAAEYSASRAWLIRLQLPSAASAHSRLLGATIDGIAAAPKLLRPSANPIATPFGGEGSRPPAAGGSVLELAVPAAAHARLIEMHIGIPTIEEVAAV
jgi:hypothetical protein